MTKRKNTEATSASSVVQFVPLNKLKKSPRNARKTAHLPADIEALAASIKAHGILQAPVVEPEMKDGQATGHFLVTIGEGRRQALLLRAKRKEIAKNEPVRCMIETEHDAYEISLAENEIRTAMHPADQFDAFHHLHSKKGMSAEDIAARFGVTPAVVKQRLKLAAISPKLVQLYRDEEMTLDVLTAFAVTDDHAKQEAVWDSLHANSDREDVLAALNEEHLPSDDPRVTFVGIDAYQKAGGGILRDLFDEESEGYVTDPALLFRLTSDKLRALADTVKAEGWKWVEAMPRYDYEAVSGCRRVYPKEPTLSAGDEAKREALEAEYSALEVQAAQDDEEDSPLHAEFARIEQAIDDLVGEKAYNPEDIALGGAIVTLSHDGEPRIERGLIRPEDDTRPRANGKASGAKADGPAPLSEKLVAELTASRTAALQNALAQKADVALTATVHALAGSIFFSHSDSPSCLTLRASETHLQTALPGIEESPAKKEIAARHAAWLEIMPDDPAALWVWIAALDNDQRLDLLAHCVSLTVDTVQRPQAHGDVNGKANELAQAVSLDMTSVWTPTTANYLGRVSKDRILEAVREAVSKEAADNLAGMKKSAMADVAAQRLAATGWLPPILRHPVAA